MALVSKKVSAAVKRTLPCECPKPMRPTRPAMLWNSLADRGSRLRVRAFQRTQLSNTAVLKGKLTPAASVLVAKTTSSCLDFNVSSTRFRSSSRRSAVWKAKRLGMKLDRFLAPAVDAFRAGRGGRGGERGILEE